MESLTTPPMSQEELNEVIDGIKAEGRWPGPQDGNEITTRGVFKSRMLVLGAALAEKGVKLNPVNV